MQPTKTIWMNGAFIPWQDATMHVLSHVAHYGSGAWEGIRCYKTDQGSGIFRLREHIERLQRSMLPIRLTLPYALSDLMDACVALVDSNGLEECYIRPLAYYGYGKMGLNPIGAEPQCIIACWSWGKYLGADTVHIRVSDFVRMHPKSTVATAKLVGNYINSIMASLEVHGDARYGESLFLDHRGFVAEGPGENFFLIKDQVIHTPSLGYILPGITRDSVMTLARDRGYTVIERDIRPEEIFEADECFFTGTAAEVVGILSVDGRQIGTGTMGTLTRLLRDAYFEATHGKDTHHHEWITPIHPFRS